MADHFNWLHLTDLHYGQKEMGPLWSNVRQAFFDDLARLHDLCGPWHAVFFTGDLVYSGTADQFNKMEAEVLSRLFNKLKQLGSGDAELLAVPGNHDLIRPEIKPKMSATVRQLIRPGGIEEIADEFWQTSGSEYHQVISKALADYSSWWNSTPWNKKTLIQTGSLPGDFATTLVVKGRRIGIAGLNTTFLQLTGDDYRGRLAWHPQQLQAVCGDASDWVNEHDACLLLTHQGSEWLTKQARDIAGPEINPAGRFAVHLFGHMHESDLTTVSKRGGNPHVAWQGCSLFGMDKCGDSLQFDRRHGYAAGRLEFRRREIAVRCWPRTADYDSNGWDLHPDHRSGRLKRDEGTTPQIVGTIRRKNSTSEVSVVHTAKAKETTQRALLTTYLRTVHSSWDIVDLAGLPEDDRHLAMQKFMLRQLYMPLRMVVEQSDDVELDELESQRIQQRMAEAGRASEQRPRRKSRISLGAWLDSIINPPEGDASTPRLVILGDPGGGKSTLLRWLATACLLRLEGSDDYKLLPDSATLPSADWVPIFIRCRELDKTALHNASLDDLLRQTLPKLELGASHISSLISLLRERLENGTAIILIDGLDEITDPNLRVAFCERLQSFAQVYDRAPILATSRIVGYREMRRRVGGGFAHATLDDLLPEEKDTFVARWCEVTVTDPQRRALEIDSLRRGIHGNDRVARLTGNPMLLTTMALVQRKVGKLPPKRHKLYWEAVDLLLRWRASPEEPSIDSDEALPQLEYLAYSMCDKGVQRLRKDEVLELLTNMRKAYPDIRPVHRQAPEQFLAVLERRTGLLTEMGAIQHNGHPVPVYEFRHLTFQEYLASLALIRGHYPGHSQHSTLAERIAPLAGRIEKVKSSRSREEALVTEHWRETLRLCVTSCNDDDVSAVLKVIVNPNNSNEKRARAILSAQCLADEPNIQTSQAERILANVASLVADGDSGEFQASPLYLVSLELAGGDWGAVLEKHLMIEFLKRSPAQRPSTGCLAAMVAVEKAKVQNLDKSEWMANRIADLGSSSDQKAASAALIIMIAAWGHLYEPDTHAVLDSKQLRDVVRGLVALLKRGPALSNAGAWALGWLASTRSESSKSLWTPSTEQKKVLIGYLADAKSDPEALRWIARIADFQKWKEAVKSLISLSTSPHPRLRRDVMDALVSIAEPSARPTFRAALTDEDVRIRSAGLFGLAKLRSADDAELFILINQGPWQDPRERITQKQILEVATLAKLPATEVHKRFQAMAKEIGFAVEPEKLQKPKSKKNHHDSHRN